MKIVKIATFQSVVTKKKRNNRINSTMKDRKVQREGTHTSTSSQPPKGKCYEGGSNCKKFSSHIP